MSRSARERRRALAEAAANGLSLDEMARQEGIKRSTVLKYLNDIVREGGSLPVDPLLAASRLSAEQREQVLAAFSRLGTQQLRPVFDTLDGKIPWEELHLLRLVARVQAQ